MQNAEPILRQKSGFTLLEVMIALAIVGGLLMTLIYTLNYHLGIAEQHEFLTIGSMLARNKIVEVEREPVSSEGKFPEPFSSYHYKAEVRESSFPGISEIDVLVSRGSDTVKFTQLIKSSK
jgi:general secretion pathway protein I